MDAENEGWNKAEWFVFPILDFLYFRLSNKVEAPTSTRIPANARWLFAHTSPRRNHR